MKRKHKSLTLWNAAFGKGSGTLKNWIDKVKIFEMTGDASQTNQTHYSDFEPKSKVSKSTNKVMCTFSVGIRPTPNQKRTLNQMLKVSNYAYNWCNYLVKEKQFKPKQFDLQKIVAKTNASDVPSEYRLPHDEWFFDNKMTTIKTTACKNFSAMYKSAQTNQKKSRVDLKNKDTTILREGSFEIQRLFVRLLTTKDITNERFLQSRIALMPANFSISKKDYNERFLKISKNVSKLPPLSHDMKISKRANGKFVLHIPCDPVYTRKNHLNDSTDSICSIDPGGRTFATCYDPSNLKCFQIGRKGDKERIIYKLHDKIDRVHE